MGFTVPSGYQSKFNLFGQEAWVRGNSSNTEMIMLITMPKTFSATDLEQNFNISSSGAMKNTKFTDRKNVVICNGQKAVLLKGTGSSSKPDAKTAKTTTKIEDMDMLVTGWGKSTYMAMYVRPHADAPDAASEAALKTLCPKAS